MHRCHMCNGDVGKRRSTLHVTLPLALALTLHHLFELRCECLHLLWNTLQLTFGRQHHQKITSAHMQ